MSFDFNAHIHDADFTVNAVANLQDAVKRRLTAHPWFAPVNVLTTQQGDIVNEIARALGTMTKPFGLGMAVVIGTPNADDSSGNIFALDLDPFYIAADIYCDPLTVDTPQGVRRSVDAVALNVLRLLKGWTPRGCSAPLTSTRPTIADLPDTTQSGLVIRRVALRGAVTLPLLRLEGEPVAPDDNTEKEVVSG